MDAQKKKQMISSEEEDNNITEMPPLGGLGRSTCPLAPFTHEEIINHPQTFQFALESFHAAFNSRIIVPVIGGKELDLYLLYAEVTKRGGFNKVVENKKWREIGTIFDFASTATSASYVMRKNYMALLYHFEQFYFFKQEAAYISQGSSVLPLPVPLASTPPSISGTCLAKGDNGAYSSHQPIPIQTIQPQEQGKEETPKQNGGLKCTALVGKIEGKIEQGYLVSVRVGSEILQGVLYHPAESEFSTPAPPSGTAILPCNQHKVFHYKKRKQRDPDLPKSNRSGYNFFVSAKHSELKALIPEREREFLKLIAEAWKGMTEEQKKVYHKIGLQDKERYRREMSDYIEKKAKALKRSDEGPSNKS